MTKAKHLTCLFFMKQHSHLLITPWLYCLKCITSWPAKMISLIVHVCITPPCMYRLFFTVFIPGKEHCQHILSVYWYRCGLCNDISQTLLAITRGYAFIFTIRCLRRWERAGEGDKRTEREGKESQGRRTEGSRRGWKGWVE